MSARLVATFAFCGLLVFSVGYGILLAGRDDSADTYTPTGLRWVHEQDYFCGTITTSDGLMHVVYKHSHTEDIPACSGGGYPDYTPAMLGID